MPNVLAHNYVTHDVMKFIPPDLALGSVLPDFVGMYRDYKGDTVLMKGVSPTLDLAIYLHRKTDEIYDSQPQKTTVTTDMAAHLEASGIKPGAARLSSHLLADLMLDGAQARQSEPRANFETLTEYVLDGETALHNGKFPPQFTRFVEQYFESDVPDVYNDPEKLAHITRKRLDARARSQQGKQKNTIDESLLGVVAEVIDIHTERVHRLGTLALSATIELLRQSTATE